MHKMVAKGIRGEPTDTAPSQERRREATPKAEEQHEAVGVVGDVQAVGRAAVGGGSR